MSNAANRTTQPHAMITILKERGIVTIRDLARYADDLGVQPSLILTAEADPKGRPLVQAIHNRKAECGLPGFESSQQTPAEPDGGQEQAAQQQRPVEQSRNVPLIEDRNGQDGAKSSDAQADQDHGVAGTLGGFPRVFHGASIAQMESGT